MIQVSSNIQIRVSGTVVTCPTIRWVSVVLRINESLLDGVSIIDTCHIFCNAHLATMAHNVKKPSLEAKKQEPSRILWSLLEKGGRFLIL